MKMKLLLRILFFIFTMLITTVGESKSSTVVNILQKETSYSFFQESQFSTGVIEEHSVNSCSDRGKIATYSKQVVYKNIVAAKGGRQTFEIADGVRRAKAAQELGHTSIKAMDHTGKTFQVPIKDLYSPFKSSIDVSTPLNQFRYDRIYNGFKAGDALPPIYVNPGSRGISIFDVNFVW